METNNQVTTAVTPEVIEQHKAPYRGVTYAFGATDRDAGSPRSLENLRSWPTAQLEKERQDMLRASFNPMFGHNAKAALDLVEKVLAERRLVEAADFAAKSDGQYGCTTPRKGTPERDALDQAFKDFDEECKKLSDQHFEIGEQIGRTKRYTKKREKAQGRIDALYARTKEMRAQIQTAYREDVVETGDEANRLSALAKLQGGSKSWRPTKLNSIVLTAASGSGKTLSMPSRSTWLR